MDEWPGNKRKRRKVDMEALHSPLKRIPGMDIASVRDLMDIGIEQIEDLNGRSPEALFEEISHMRGEVPQDRLYSIRMAVYFAETDEPEARLLQPWKWTDSGLPD